jgi:cathepsin B
MSNSSNEFLTEQRLPAVSEDLVNEINARNVGWTAAMNGRVADVSMSTVKSWLGALPGRTLPVRASLVSSQAIPDEFDARQQWFVVVKKILLSRPQCTTVSQVRDQGPCGSCWAFGAVEAMSDRLALLLLSDPIQSLHFHQWQGRCTSLR